MKHEKLMSCLWATLLAFLLGFGSTACMVTGLALPADLLWLACGCAVGALIAAVCFTVRRGFLILSGITAVNFLILAFSSRFWNQFRAMCYSAVAYYNRGYGIPIPNWINGQTAESQLLPLLLIGGLVMTAAAWTVIRRKRAYPAVGGALLPLSSCLVVTDTVPQILPIFLLLLGLVLLMMTQTVRRRNETQGNRLTGILVLPVTAALLGLVFLVPQGDYSAPAQVASLQEMLDWFAQKLPIVEQTTQGELVISIGGNAKDEVNLTQVGHRVERNTPVMELETEYSGTLYLRGRDYDVYSGLGWQASEDRTEDGYGPAQIWCTSQETVSIRVLGRRGQYYLPCYPAENQTLIGGLIPNPDYVNTYTYRFSALRADWKNLWQNCQNGDVYISPEPAPDERYLELPDETRQRAEAVLAQLNPLTGKPPDVAEAVRVYVSNSATYDLNPGRMPGSETDFAMWFLEQSDTGYCIHFASAATVLLRAAGIPARYVEGYTVQATGGQTTIVREKTAHAWVEYYLDHIGWVILDPTPGSSEAPEETTSPAESTTAPTAPSPTDGPDPTLSVTEPDAATPPDTSVQSGQHTGTTSSSHIIRLPGDGSGNGSGGNAMITVPQWFLNLLAVLAWVAVIGLVILAQWLVRRHIKLRRMHQGRPNAQALARYRETRLMARLWKIPVPDELIRLAEKAKFSQHELTRRELGRFDTFLREGAQALRETTWFYRLVCRFVFAAY